ncbi:tetratricopeptide repeat protein, partial [Desulfovibrio sp. OttesenSCG-928-O18]|nr:tetratricopeptide repeat protein [Desulfovibrio sp. OttesenSCG-928-O18]
DDVRARYDTLSSLLAARFFPGQEGAVTAVGIAGYPYLDFRKADVLENCRKALEYGILLPHPHVGVFDSLAMTISADKRFSHGDILGAMTEYQQALLADENNALAWNSLGVTLARLGRHDEARGHFDKAIAQQPDAMTLYNMGYSCQCLGERSEARYFYEQCLQKDKDHMYAMVRLGQLAEAGGDNARAREFYDQAVQAPDGRAVTRRYLAGLALREGKTEEAREHLHEALSLDPQNAVALQMLAEIYLDGGEDAEVAESLARQSVVLRPALKAGWLTLSRALERTGRTRDAREALMRAGEL